MKPFQKLGPHFARACAVETGVVISQKTEIYRKDVVAQSQHPDQAPAFYTYRKNLSMWTHCLGNNIKYVATVRYLCTCMTMYTIYIAQFKS